jgi:hypothetical protein
LVENGVLLKDESEYNLQTKEYSDWNREFDNRKSRLVDKDAEIHSKRDALIRAAAFKAIKDVQVDHGGERGEKRRLMIHFGEESPEVDGDSVPIWIRDGYSATEKNVVDAARAAGTNSPIVFVYLPRGNSDGLKNQIIRYEAAAGTIQFKGVPSTPEGEEAKSAMQTRENDAKALRDEFIAEIIDAAKVFKGGGTEVNSLTIDQKVAEAGKAALIRMFPEFKDADYKNWPVVISRAKNGDESPLQAIKWNDEAKQHPVCKALLREIGAGVEGRELHKKFGATPYGWPQDAIDGALMAMHNAGDVTVRYSGESVPLGKLDQTKIKRAEFRQENRVISGREKLALRGLFQAAGVAARPNDDLEVKSSEFLAQLLALASKAGGDAPLPPRPDPQHLLEIRNFAGNERLGKILEQLESLKQAAEHWKALGELAEKRESLWSTLQQLIHHGESITEISGIKSKAEGIRKDRLLLDATDHVSGLAKKAAEILRNAVTSAHAQYQATYESQSEQLTTVEAWAKTDSSKQQQILASQGISGVPPVNVGSDIELLRSLNSTPLSSWSDKTDALVSRFATAAAQAARLLEPELQRVHLTSSTLKTEDDVRKWLAEKETELISKVSKGPIIIS